MAAGGSVSSSRKVYERWIPDMGADALKSRKNRHEAERASR